MRNESQENMKNIIDTLAVTITINNKRVPYLWPRSFMSSASKKLQQADLSAFKVDKILDPSWKDWKQPLKHMQTGMAKKTTGGLK